MKNLFCGKADIRTKTDFSEGTIVRKPQHHDFQHAEVGIDPRLLK